MKRLLPLFPLAALLLTTMGVGPCDSQPLGSLDGGDGCVYKGTTYATGATFKDSCSTCTCNDAMIACTTVACADGGSAGASGTGGNGTVCYNNAGKVVSCGTGGTTGGHDAGVCFNTLGNVITCGTGGSTGTVDAAAGNDAGPTCYGPYSEVIPCTTGGGTTCTSPDGTVYPVGSSYACDCTMCQCTATGVIFPTVGCPTDAGANDATPICFDNSGAQIPCGSYDAGTSCDYYGTAYAAGVSFLSVDGCNTCTCGMTGMIACTEKACADAGNDAATDGPSICFDSNGAAISCPRIDAGVTYGCMPGEDQVCNEDPAISVDLGTCVNYQCDCGSNATSLYTGRCLDSTDTTGNGCEYQGKLVPVGSKFMCGQDCGTCMCQSPGKFASLCEDQECSFDAAYSYGAVGGLSSYSDQVTLTPPASYVLVRTANVNAGGTTGGSCGPAFPMCGGTEIDVSDIMADILDPTVQLLISLSTTQSTFLGVDERPVDGTAFSFKKSGTMGFLVGAPCNGAAGCTDIPASAAKLVSDLQKLDQQQRADPSCASFIKM